MAFWKHVQQDHGIGFHCHVPLTNSEELHRVRTDVPVHCLMHCQLFTELVLGLWRLAWIAIEHGDQPYGEN